jgi:hypothetical protein
LVFKYIANDPPISSNASPFPDKRIEILRMALPLEYLELCVSDGLTQLVMGADRVGQEQLAGARRIIAV